MGSQIGQSAVGQLDSSRGLSRLEPIPGVSANSSQTNKIYQYYYTNDQRANANRQATPTTKRRPESFRVAEVPTNIHVHSTSVVQQSADHLSTESDEWLDVRSYDGVCPICDRKMFGRNRHQNLRHHMRIHTGCRPYTCPFCSYTGRQHNHIRSHVLRMHPDLFNNYNQLYLDPAHPSSSAEDNTSSFASRYPPIGVVPIPATPSIQLQPQGAIDDSSSHNE